MTTFGSVVLGFVLTFVVIVGALVLGTIAALTLPYHP